MLRGLLPLVLPPPAYRTVFKGTGLAHHRLPQLAERAVLVTIAPWIRDGEKFRVYMPALFGERRPHHHRVNFAFIQNSNRIEEGCARRRHYLPTGR